MRIRSVARFLRGKQSRAIKAAVEVRGGVVEVLQDATTVRVYERLVSSAQNPVPLAPLEEQPDRENR